MRSNNTKPVALHSEAETSAQLFHDWFDPIEMGVRSQVRGFIEGMIEAELETVLSRPRYGRPTKTRDAADNVPAGLSGHRHGHRSRSVAVPVPAQACRDVVGRVPGLCRAAVAWPRQHRLKLSLDHTLDKAPHLRADAHFNRVEPVVKKLGARLSFRM